MMSHPQHKKDRFSSLPHTSFDLAVIGGGINGTAIARDAALRGLSVILLEKSDFGTGASTKTSKLAHGGLRYLEQGEFGLVKESLYERDLLLKNAPHLVCPLPFVYPVYSNSPRSLWQVNLGLYFYDFFSRKSGLPSHRKLSKQEVLTEFPSLKEEGLKGGITYYDAQMKDNRLVIENMLAAELAGALVFNYAKVATILSAQGSLKKIIIKDTLTNLEKSVTCKVIVNATGAWSDSISRLEHQHQEATPLVAPTKGVHLVIPQQCHTGLILSAPQDGRVFFVLPWNNYSLVGATDTFYSNDPDLVSTDQADIDYLLTAFRHHFPHSPVNAQSIICTFAGLRPLAADQSQNSPSGLSRSHMIRLLEGNMITVLGGKYTTHRKVAQQTVDLVVRQLGNTHSYASCSTHERPLPGAPSSQQELTEQLALAGLTKEQAQHLLHHYGQLCTHILDIIRKHPEQAQSLCSSHPHLLAEVSYAITHEHALKLEDWFCRRTTIAYCACQGRQCIETVASQFASLLGWSPSYQELAIEEYLLKNS